jgi:hypothetical protein
MKKFSQYIKEKKVIKKSKDPAQARSLFVQAQERMKDLLTLPLHDSNASFRFEDAYEVLREALHSFLAQEGYKPYSHEAIFSYANEQKLLLDADVYTADRYRIIRNDINYRAKKVTIEEAREIIEYIQRIIPHLNGKRK